MFLGSTRGREGLGAGPQEEERWAARDPLPSDGSRTHWRSDEGPSFRREEAEAMAGCPVQPGGRLHPFSLQTPKVKPERQRPFLRTEGKVAPLPPPPLPPSRMRGLSPPSLPRVLPRPRWDPPHPGALTHTWGSPGPSGPGSCPGGGGGALGLGPAGARLSLTQLADVAINSQGELEIEVGEEKGEGAGLLEPVEGRKGQSARSPEEEDKAGS